MIEFNNAYRVPHTTVLHKLLLIVKIGRPKTWMYPIVSFIAAYLGGDSLVLWHVGTAVAILSLGTAATNLINHYTDMDEDRVNHPFRLEWIRRLGIRNLILATVITYSLAILLSLPFGLFFTFVIILATLDSIFYSLPPLRFKKHPVSSLVAFSGAVGLPYLAGLIAVDKFSLTDPSFILFTLFFMTFGTMKNVPDYLGDRLADVKTNVTAFGNLRKAIIATTVVVLSPYFLVLLFVGLGVLSRLYLLDMLLMAFPIYWTYRNFRANTREDLEKTFFYAYLYAVFFLLFNMILKNPSIISMSLAALVISTVLLVQKLKIDSRLQVPFNTSGLQTLLDKGDKFAPHGH